MIRGICSPGISNCLADPRASVCGFAAVATNFEAQRSATLATVGAFRAVPESDLRDSNSERQGRRDRRARSGCANSVLSRTMPYVVGQTRTAVVTLTDRGRAVLESARHDRDGQRAQAFHAGILKPRELAHDARLYAAYLKSSERLIAGGARVRRVVLEEDLKRDYQRFLQESNRGRRDSSGRPDREPEEIERWARERELPFDDGHVQFPDVRIEYDDRDGHARVEDVEVTTPNYRGAHASAKVRAGFTRYRATGARLAGSGSGRRGGRGARSSSSGGDPRMTLAERVRHVAAHGFTDRQAEFLVTVMLHSGVCMDRHYCAFARIPHGRKTCDFFHRLVLNRYATAYACAHSRARIFHLQHHPLYEAIDEPDNRFRRPVPIARASRTAHAARHSSRGR